MAHIKVVRRSMRPEEWTDLRFGWLKRHIYSSKWEIKNLMIRDARQVSEMEFEYYSEDYRPLNKGDMYFTPDGTAFIKADVDIPEELQGKELWFSLKTAAEICVKVNGRYIGGVDPNRERMLLSPYVNSKETLHFDMMGYNRSKPDDERNPESLSVRGCRQIFEGAYICTVNHSVQDLVWDFELLLDIAKSELFSEDYRNFLNKELNNAMNFIDFESDKLSGVEEAQKYLDEVVFANDTYKGSGDVALIAHSHLDIAYYWRRIHAVQKNLRTVLIQLRLMDKYPDFKYTHTQPYVYETLEKYYPDVFEELKEKVRSVLRERENCPSERKEKVCKGSGEEEALKFRNLQNEIQRLHREAQRYLNLKKRLGEDRKRGILSEEDFKAFGEIYERKYRGINEAARRQEEYQRRRAAEEQKDLEGEADRNPDHEFLSRDQLLSHVNRVYVYENKCVRIWFREEGV